MLVSVPFKGQVLNETSAFWMRRSSHIIKIALLAVPDPNVCVSSLVNKRVQPEDFEGVQVPGSRVSQQESDL